MEIVKNKLIFNLVYRGLTESLQTKDLSQKVAMGVYSIQNLPENVKSAIKDITEEKTMDDADSVIICKLLVDPNTEDPKKMTEDKFHDLISRCLYLDKSDVTILSVQIDGSNFLVGKIKFVDETKKETTSDANTKADDNQQAIDNTADNTTDNK